MILAADNRRTGCLSRAAAAQPLVPRRAARRRCGIAGDRVLVAAGIESAGRGRRDQQLAAHGFVLDFCGVEIDRETGRVMIDKYVTLHDAAAS